MANLAYSVERTYLVEPRAMWRAWTDVSALEQWCAPTELSVVPGSVVSDPVEGGRWAVAVDATAYGHIAYFWGRYTEVEPRHDIVIDMEARDGGTGVRFAQYGEMPADQAAMRKRAWRATSTPSGSTSLAD